jgi:hypothetical protein
MVYLFVVQDSGDSFIHNGRGVFGSDFGSCAFVIKNDKIPAYKGIFRRLFEKQGSVSNNEELASIFSIQKNYLSSSLDFAKVPGSPIAYWITDSVRNAFVKFIKIGNKAKKGLTTADNQRFVRLWYEVSNNKLSIDGGYKWYPMTKGGTFRKWFGNNEYVINWENNGQSVKAFSGSVIRNEKYYFKEGITWNDVSISTFSARYIPEGYICNAVGPMIYGGDVKFQLCALNSTVIALFLRFLCPTVKFEVGSIALIPIPEGCKDNYTSIAEEAMTLSRDDWNSVETAWDFQYLPWCNIPLRASNLGTSWQNWQAHCNAQIRHMQELEAENNRIFIEAYGLQDELTPEVPEDQITLASADREADVKRLISYSVGCMTGRYSLDEPGLIYANSGSVEFDGSKYKTFPADDDGIIPVMDMDWFEDDAANRFEEFLGVAWSDPSPQPSPSRGEGALLDENMKFVADSLSPKAAETPRETIRRYFSTQFYKDHTQTYKKRPIYWLFSSGKQRAFECLVYLHRYNESTLSRMRNEYVTPLQGKFSARVEYLTNERDAATSTSARTKLQKQLDTLKKKQVELAAFDDLRRHYADKRIPLDLDDGVKVNYGKFGNLLAEVKAITGGDSE